MSDKVYSTLKPILVTSKTLDEYESDILQDITNNNYYISIQMPIIVSTVDLFSYNDYVKLIDCFENKYIK